MAWRKLMIVAVAAVVAVVAAGGAAGAQSSGNGGFTVGPLGAGYIGFVGNKDVWSDITIQCSTGFTCGLTNIEVDWDDGSAIDSHVTNLPVWEYEFYHEYQANGLYHVFFSADDDNSNWWNTTRDLQVTVY